MHPLKKRKSSPNQEAEAPARTFGKKESRKEPSSEGQKMLSQQLVQVLDVIYNPHSGLIDMNKMPSSLIIRRRSHQREDQMERNKSEDPRGILISLFQKDAFNSDFDGSVGFLV